MQEKQVTVAHTSHQLEEPFFVMATQNPLEMEAGPIRCRRLQLDRFLFKLRVPCIRGRDDLHDILDRTDGRARPRLVQPVVNGAQILEMRQVVARTVSASAPQCPGVCREIDAGNASGSA